MTQNWQILAVEDDPDGQEVVALILLYHQIPVDVVASAEEALTILQTKQYSGIIIDLHLPGMDGWRLMQAIKNDPRSAAIPCVAITAYHTDDLAVQAIEAGFRAYFPKPLEPTSFVRELENIF